MHDRAVRGGTGRSAYGASKGGIITLTKTMAVELAECGITVNALAPGPIDTELVARMHDDATRRAYTHVTPVNRYGSPEEVAAAALFLASCAGRSGEPADPSTQRVKCLGINECAGQSACDVAGAHDCGGQNDCKGKNPCKGKGGCKTG